MIGCSPRCQANEASEWIFMISRTMGSSAALAAATVTCGRSLIHGR